MFSTFYVGRFHSFPWDVRLHGEVSDHPIVEQRSKDNIGSEKRGLAT